MHAVFPLHMPMRASSQQERTSNSLLRSSTTSAHRNICFPWRTSLLFYLKTSPATSYPESVLLHHGSILKYQRLIHRLHMPWADNTDGYGDKRVGGVYCVDPLDQRILISQGRIPKWLPWDLSGYSRWTIFMPMISLNWDATVPTYPVSTENASNTPARVCGHLQNPCCLLLAAVWSSWQVEVAGSWTEWVHVIVE